MPGRGRTDGRRRAGRPTRQHPASRKRVVRLPAWWAAGGADIIDALRFAAAEKFVLALPEGLETILGDRGILISQGERQRIAIARALLRRPALLVLDEATNSLDSETEASVLDAIER